MTNIEKQLIALCDKSIAFGTMPRSVKKDLREDLDTLRAEVEEEWRKKNFAKTVAMIDSEKPSQVSVDVPEEPGWYWIEGIGYIYCHNYDGNGMVAEYIKDMPTREVWKDKWYKVSDDPILDKAGQASMTKE